VLCKTSPIRAIQLQEGYGASVVINYCKWIARFCMIHNKFDFICSYFHVGFRGRTLSIIWISNLLHLCKPQYPCRESKAFLEPPLLSFILYPVSVAPDKVQNTEAFFAGLNEFWAAELRDILLPQDQLSVYREPLRRGNDSLWHYHFFSIIFPFNNLVFDFHTWLFFQHIGHLYQSNCFAATFGYLYKGTVCGLFEDQPRKRLEVSIKALPPGK